MIKQVYSLEFKEEVGNGLTIVDFFTDLCSPCQMLSDILEELESEMQEKVKFLKVDINKSVDLANKFKITSVPTLIIFKNGEPIDTLIGFLHKEKLKEKLESYL